MIVTNQGKHKQTELFCGQATFSCWKSDLTQQRGFSNAISKLSTSLEASVPNNIPFYSFKVYITQNISPQIQLKIDEELMINW